MATLRHAVVILAVLTVLAGGATAARASEAFRLLELDGLPVKWGEPQLSLGGTVSYRIVEQARQVVGARNCRTLVPIDGLLQRSAMQRDEFRKHLRAAVAMWEAAADISFVPAAPDSDADILIGAQGKPRGIAFADVIPSDTGATGVRAILRGLICLNPDHQWSTDQTVLPGRSLNLQRVLAHELGHTIGLDHPGPRGALMSFMLGDAVRGLQPGDSAGAVLLYGRPKLAATDEIVETAATDE